jgi:hypothetical protein
MQEQECPKCKQKNPKRAKMCRNCGSILPNHADNHALQELFSEDATIFPMALTPYETPYEDDKTLPHRQSESVDSTPVDTRSIFIPEEEPTDTSNMGVAIMQGGLILLELTTNTRFHIQADELNEIVIGRVNHKTNYKPTVDLSTVEGQKFGVSRRHATLRKAGSLLQLVDHHSVNGTYLNGDKIEPQQIRIVRDKDVIRFGGITLQVLYVNEVL